MQYISLAVKTFIAVYLNKVIFMKNLFLILICLIFVSGALAQKGVDTQTKTIKDEGTKTTNSGNKTDNNATRRTFDFGKEKAGTRNRLANPYRLNSRRDRLVDMIMQILADNKIIVDESSSRLSEGVIVTQPFTFAKGAVITRNELSRYADLPGRDSIFTRGRYTLTIEVRSIDGIQNDVYVLANVEGRQENGLTSEWTTLSSTGVAENDFLKKLIETVTGINPDAEPIKNETP